MKSIHRWHYDNFWKKRWFWPYLDFWFDIGLISIRTVLEHDACYEDVRDHIIVEVKVWRRQYGFRFRLYTPSVIRQLRSPGTTPPKPQGHAFETAAMHVGKLFRHLQKHGG